MSMITPYLYFEGRCEEALEFYKTALGASIGMMMRFRDAPSSEAAPPIPPGSEDRIMHATFSVDGTVVMVSDGMCSGKTGFSGFSLSLAVRDTATAERYFAALAEGGQVRMPLAETFFSPRFGMLADKFGLGWLIMVEA